MCSSHNTFQDGGCDKSVQSARLHAAVLRENARQLHAVTAALVSSFWLLIEQQTTNLGVRSSNLFGRANKINNL